MFELDQRLRADCVEVGAFALSRLLLMNDAHYPWFILVPQRADVSEVFDLTAAEQQQMWEEVNLFAVTLKNVFLADKINIATLGNVVGQLHIHVIARFRDDIAWPAPVWGRHPAEAYNDEQLGAVLNKIRHSLGADFVWTAGESL